MHRIKKNKNARVFEQIIDRFKESIYKGEFKRGDKIPSERDLKKLFNVSRASIREALRVLEIIGLIESRPGEGTFIKENRDKIYLEPLSMVLMLEDNITAELLELRKALEIDSVRLTAERVTAEEIKKLQEFIDVLKNSTGDDEKSIEADRDFHYMIAKASKNKVLFDVMIAISEAMDYHIKHTRTKFISKQENMMMLAKQHQKILDYIKERNQEKAIELMKEHLEYVEGLIKKEI